MTLRLNCGSVNEMSSDEIDSFDDFIGNFGPRSTVSHEDHVSSLTIRQVNCFLILNTYRSVASCL